MSDPTERMTTDPMRAEQLIRIADQLERMNANLRSIAADLAEIEDEI